MFEVIMRCFRMDLETVTLLGILGDKADTDVVKCEVILQVVKKLSDTRFLICDHTGSAKIEFEPKSQKMADMITEKKTYRFFGLHRTNTDTLLYTNTSNIKEETELVMSGSKEKTFFTTKDLIGKMPKSIVQDLVLLKVVSINEAIVTGKSGIMRSVFLADNHHAVYMTFWKQDVSKLSELMKEGDVVSIKIFELDDYPEPVMRPRDFVFRSQTPATIIQKVYEDKAPDRYVDVLGPEKSIYVQGVVKFIDQVYEYKSCPGENGIICGETVKEGTFYCEKQGCKVEVSKVHLKNDYRITLIVFGLGGIQQLTAFRDSLRDFEDVGKKDVQEKLKSLMDIDVNIRLQENSKDDENPTVVKITKF